MIDLDDKRLAVAKQLGATTLINSADGLAAQHVMEQTGGAGADVAIEAVGVPATFAICQHIVAAGGRIANVGVHGKSVELHLDKLWDRNIAITRRLVDTITTSLLLKVVGSGKLEPGIEKQRVTLFGNNLSEENECPYFITSGTVHNI